MGSLNWGGHHQPIHHPPTSLSVERVRLMNLAYPLTYLHTRPIHLSAYILKYLGGVRGGATTPPDFVGSGWIPPFDIRPWGFP